MMADVTEPLLTKPFLSLVLAHFLQGLSAASMLLLPLYVTHLGGQRLDIGIIVGAGYAGSLLFRPVVGIALDTWGRRATITSGTILLAAGMASFAWVDTLGALAIAARFFVGIGIGSLFAGYFAFVSDIIPESRRTQGTALFGISGLTPIVINPVAESLGIQGSALRWFYPLLGLVALLSLLPLFAVKGPETRSRPRAKGTYVLSSARRLVHPRLWSVWLATSLLGGAVGVLASFLTLIAASRGVADPQMVWISYALGAVVCRVGGLWLPEPRKKARVLLVALISYGAAAIVCAKGTGAAHFLAAGALAGIGHGLGFPVLVSSAVSRIAPESRGAGVATLTALWELGSLASAPLAGWLADSIGDAPMFQWTGLAVFAATAAWFALESAKGDEVVASSS